jgi:predicted anti-sigma-YlaC factor YlaD
MKDKECNHVLGLLSEYCDAQLDDKHRVEVEAHLDECRSCSDELVGMKRSLRLLQNMPMPEPSIDLWPEFVTQLDAIEAEVRLSPWRKLELAWHHAMSDFAEGVVVYTHILAHNTLSRMEKYLVRDPFEINQ